LGIFGQVGNLRQRPRAIDANERRRPFFVGHLRSSWQSSAKTVGHRCERPKAAIFRWASSVKLAIFGKDRGPSMRTSEGGHFSLGIFGQVGNLRQRPRVIDANERRRPLFVGNLRSSWPPSVCWNSSANLDIMARSLPHLREDRDFPACRFERAVRHNP